MVLACASSWLAADVGVAGGVGLRLPLVDTADPLPWNGHPRPVGGGRVDLLPGVVLHTAGGQELGAQVRWSPYGLAWPNGALVFADRGALEVEFRQFVAPHDERTEWGQWIGGYAGGTAALELWGKYAPGPPQLATLHAVVGYRGEVADYTPAWLELGLGVWGDRHTGDVGIGGAIRAGVWAARPLVGYGTSAPPAR